MKTFRHRVGNATLGLTAIFLLSGESECGPPIIENNGFDLWCGDHLCGWEVEAGQVRQVPTWHRSDKGVELVGERVVISQLSDATWYAVECIRFDLVADVEMTATLTLEVDFYDDGVVEFSEPIPTSHWEPIYYLVTPPYYYQDIRFRVTKEGPGQVVLAQVHADRDEGCPARKDLALGEYCASDWECASGICNRDVIGTTWAYLPTCGECRDSEDCGSGEVCGLEVPCRPSHYFYTSCGPAGRHEFAERCAFAKECATGHCSRDGVCSTCTNSLDCDSGEECTTHEDIDTWSVPWQCDPGGGGTDSGEPCLTDQDCASGTCLGEWGLAICTDDGRPCESAEDCPRDEECVTIGTIGGTCE